MSAEPFSPHMGAVARKVLGDPNPQLSSVCELRFGAHGSVSVDLEKGVWSDHEAKTGGGVLDFLKSHKGLEKGEALDWLRREVGADLEDRRVANDAPPPRARIVATYDYVDESGEVLFQACRMEPKTFRQRRPDPSSPDGWSWSVKGLRLIPYRLPEVLKAIAMREPVYIVEGEKDVDNLFREGLVATCNPMGAGKWTDAMSEHFLGAEVVIMPDNDDAGRNHAAQVGASLRGIAKAVRVLDLPGLPPKGDVSDWLAAGGDGVELTILAAKAKAWAPEAPKSAFGAIPWSRIDQARAEVVYAPLVKGMMYQGDKGMIYGESGSGKSFLAVDMGLAIARGVPFLGMKTAQGAVLYQAGEGGRGLLKRMAAYRQENRVVEDVPFILLPERVNLFAGDGDAEAFISECCAWQTAITDPLRAIFIDTFSTASEGANENDSADMGRMLSVGDRLGKATGAAVIWVHHKNATGLRERGHTSFRANIETVIEVIKDAETKARTLHLVKLKDGEDGLRLGFELQSVQIGTDDDGDPITSCVVRPAQVGSGQTSKRNRLPTGQLDFLKVLDSAISQWGGVVPGVDAYGVERDALRELYKSVCGFSKEPEAIRQQWARVIKELLIDGLIGHQDPWFWITDKGGRWL